MEHPITPPPELRRLWAQQAQRLDPHDPVAWMEHVSTQAACWGADRELKAFCEWTAERTTQWSDGAWPADALRASRRPKPPSLAEQALALLDDASTRLDAVHENTIRRALEWLQELEKGNE